jgi:hypothetical protein
MFFSFFSILFRGDKLVTDASACKVYDPADSLVPRRCVRAGAWSGASAREVYDRADMLVLGGLHVRKGTLPLRCRRLC